MGGKTVNCKSNVFLLSSIFCVQALVQSKASTFSLQFQVNKYYFQQIFFMQSYCVDVSLDGTPN